MLLRCTHCNKEAIEEVYGKAYCEEHFIKYFMGKIRSVIDKFNIKGKIAVALSGGKDSAACFYALYKLKLELIPFYIDLGIKEYSKACLKEAEKICNELGYELNVIELEEYGIDLNKKKRQCSICGTAKRYLMNKFAYENACNYVATGHNLSDIVTFALNNFANVNILNFRGNKPYLEGNLKYKMVSKVKPLYYLKDKECMLYAYINDLPYCDMECPYSINAPTLKIKEWLNEIEKEMPGIILNFAKSFWKIEDKMQEKEKVKLNRCEICQYPSYGKMCKFCKIRFKSSPHKKPLSLPP